jgi:hypothetical protein
MVNFFPVSPGYRAGQWKTARFALEEPAKGTVPQPPGPPARIQRDGSVRSTAVGFFDGRESFF